MGQPVTGYEIHHGRVVRGEGVPGWVHLDPADDHDHVGADEEGATSCDGGRFLGTTLHGLFESDGFRATFLAEVGRRAAKVFTAVGVSFAAAREAQCDRLADLLESHLDLAALESIIGEGTPRLYRRSGSPGQVDHEPPTGVEGAQGGAASDQGPANCIAGPFARARVAIRPVDEIAGQAAADHHDRLAKPKGSLGALETLGIRLAAIAGCSPPPLPLPAAVAVFAGDHGVHARGVSPWPQEVTARMVEAVVGGQAAINVLARQVGASVTVIDVGVAHPIAVPSTGSGRFLDRKLRAGTDDLSRGPAMTDEEAERALDVGAEVAARLVAGGARGLVTGELGIANTTAAAAVVAALAGRPAVETTGRGTGVDEATLAHKVAVVDEALACLPPGAEPLAVLASLGGFEIAALAGFIMGGAAARVPVVIDGVIAGAALLVASALVPDALGYCVAGHRSPEPGASVVLDDLGLVPVLDLGLRLGEGTGACLALPVLEAGARILAEMATLASAGVGGPPAGRCDRPLGCG
jgi:nicotinate-nucleotide--dimethylbenzimidazole phosphoribosyltransferase